MALQDPQDLGYVPLDAVVPAAVAPAPWEWPAQFQVDPADYGVFAPTDQQIGGTAGVIENAAAPAITAPQPDFDPAAINPLVAIDQGMASLGPGGVLEGANMPAPDPLVGWEGQFSPVKALDRGMVQVGPAAAETRRDAFAESNPDQYGSILARDPAQLLRQEFDLETQRADRDREQLKAAQADDRDLADQNARMQLEAATKARAETARLNAEATAIGNTKIVRDRRSRGQTVGDVILAALGGLVSARTGGPNVGLNIVLQRINDDVDDQKADLANRQQMLGMKRNFIADELARSGDMFKAQELYRLSLHDAAIADIKDQSMKFKPGGTRAIQLAKLEAGIMQSRAAALQALEDRNLKTASDSANIEHRLLENKKLRGQLLGDGGASARVARAAFGEQAFQSIVPPAGWAGTQKQWIDQRNAYLTGKKSEQEISSGGKLGEEQRKIAEEQRQQELTRGGIGLTDYDKDGKRVEFRPKGIDSEVAALRAKTTGTREMIALLDEAMSIRTGWSSDSIGSAENRRLKTIMGKLKLAAKDTENLGAITESDADLISGLIGTDDFTEWKSVSAAVEQARRGLTQSLRIKAAGAGMSTRAAGEIDFPNPYAAKTLESQKEAQYRALLGDKLDHNDAQRVMGEISVDAQSTDPKVNGPARAKLRKLVEDAPRELDRRSIKNWLTLPEFGGGQ